jgi:hypothetical protein
LAAQIKANKGGKTNAPKTGAAYPAARFQDDYGKPRWNNLIEIREIRRLLKNTWSWKLIMFFKRQNNKTLTL